MTESRPTQAEYQYENLIRDLRRYADADPPAAERIQMRETLTRAADELERRSTYAPWPPRKMDQKAIRDILQKMRTGDALTWRTHIPNPERP
jgi:hypothetical protein